MFKHLSDMDDDDLFCTILRNDPAKVKASLVGLKLKTAPDICRIIKLFTLIIKMNLFKYQDNVEFFESMCRLDARNADLNFYLMSSLSYWIMKLSIEDHYPVWELVAGVQRAHHAFDHLLHHFVFRNYAVSLENTSAKLKGMFRLGFGVYSLSAEAFHVVVRTTPRKRAELFVAMGSFKRAPHDEPLIPAEVFNRDISQFLDMLVKSEYRLFLAERKTVLAAVRRLEREKKAETKKNTECLRVHLAKPLSLKDASRVAVRDAIRETKKFSSLEERVNTLEIPSVLKRYLVFNKTIYN